MASSKKTSKKKKDHPSEEPLAMTPQEPETDPYFDHPHWLKVWHEKLLASPWARGLILAGILAGLAVGAVKFAQKLEQPPSLAALLPADETVAFFEFDLDQLPTLFQDASVEFPWNPTTIEQHLTALLPNPESPLPEWVGDRAGLAWVVNSQGDVEEWVFLEADTSPTATIQEGQTLETLREDPEYWKFQNEAFFESDPGQEWLAKGYLVLGPASVESGVNSVLWDVLEGTTPSLKNSEDFTVLRPKLTYEAPFFGYANPSLVQGEQALETLLGSDGVAWLSTAAPAFQRDALKALIPVFPAMGFTVEPGPSEIGGVELHTVWVGDKTVMDGEALFHLENKYQGDLLERLSESVVTFHAGRDTITQAEQLIALLNALNGTGDLLHAYLLSQGIPYLGDAEAVEPFWEILNGELVAGTLRPETACDDAVVQEDALAEEPPEDVEPTVALEESLTEEEPAADLEETPVVATDAVCVEPEPLPFLLLQLDSETQPLFESFLAAVLSHGVVEVDTTSGVVTHATLTLTTQDLEGIKVNVLERDDGGVLWAYAVDEDQVLTLASDTTTLALLLSNEPRAMDPRFTRAAAFGDQIHFTTLNPAVAGISQIFSALNLYDDGLATWHHFLFE